MGQEGDKFLAPYPARPGVRDRSSRAVLRPQPAARLVARDVPRARGWLELHDGREDSRKLERRLLLPLAEAETHHVPVTPARERARPQHPERVVPHLVVGHDAAAVARGHGRVQPVEVVVLFARRGEEDALLAPAREQPRLLGSGRPARRVLLVQHEQHSRRTPLPPDALDRAQQPVHLLQVEELLAMRLRLAPSGRVSDVWRCPRARRHLHLCPGAAAPPRRRRKRPRRRRLPSWALLPQRAPAAARGSPPCPGRRSRCLPRRAQSPTGPSLAPSPAPTP
mmetsp:Transcript_10546/g.33411  ORF Transcript_10546/g.33411 Transcript_10546/m.33411 type:complete len:281 (+) Transcript_10546:198-1040(+)